MNSKEIFEEYTKATAKRKYITDKAAELGVKESDIVCELLKSGYKFEEIRRANKGIYNAGMNKFKKWQENGSPEDEDADALEQHAEPESMPEYDYPSTDEGETVESSDEDLMKIISELKYQNEALEIKNKSLAEENVELKAENSKYEKDIEIRDGRIEDLAKRKKQFMARINELEAVINDHVKSGSKSKIDYSNTVFSAGVVCYNMNNFTKCIVLDGEKGTDADRCSAVLEFSLDKLMIHEPPNRALIPTGEFFDLKALKRFLTVSEHERKEVFEKG